MLDAGLILLAALAPALALNRDTFGLPPCTPVEQEWKLAASNVEGPALLCARSQAEWALAWILYVPGADPVPPVDFERFMVVGLLQGKRDPARVIYRIELDDAAHPAALTVRCARHDSVTLRGGSTRLVGATLHLVVTPKSALPLNFVQDDMVDGMIFHWTGGVDETPLGRVEALSIPPKAEGILLREDAERRVRTALGEAEIAELKQGLGEVAHGLRYPQLWSRVAVTRRANTWAVEYDGSKFEVDAVSGEVRRCD